MTIVVSKVRIGSNIHTLVSSKITIESNIYTLDSSNITTVSSFHTLESSKITTESSIYTLDNIIVTKNNICTRILVSKFEIASSFCQQPTRGFVQVWLDGSKFINKSILNKSSSLTERY